MLSFPCNVQHKHDSQDHSSRSVPDTIIAALAGCNTVVMNPSGDIAAQQAHLITVSVVLMLLIIVPVLFLVVVFRP
jgi:cytochrome o ubiquinol oxidase subunit 2